ncbi:hypothetical protein [Thalassotalea atypica]|uniref:hypothetical protein n=1 Tax=Thalassotalea atypica TaxID=2054316 RepID=UPI0025747796|nr:hypothetical protein [Thalassotalea atypica]
MSDVQFALRWAVIGLVLALSAFIFNFTMYPASLPAYELIAGPAMLALMPFSEETPFWPKLAIFLIGQYLFYVLVIFVFRKLVNLLK